MRQVNIHEAKTHLSRLVDEAGEGETIIMAKAGKPVAALVPLDVIKAISTSADEAGKERLGSNDPLSAPYIDRRRFGFMKGMINVPDDFDMMHQDEIIAMFEGSE
jgi:prevent-host-death family protein